MEKEMNEKKGKLWFEGKKYQYYIITEEDFIVIMKLLDKVRKGFGEQNEYDRVFNRLIIQKRNLNE